MENILGMIRAAECETARLSVLERSASGPNRVKIQRDLCDARKRVVELTEIFVDALNKE